jgi:hypothetical protein
VANREQRNTAKFSKVNHYFDDAQGYQKDKKRLKKDKRKDNGKRKFLDEDDNSESR